MYFSFGEDVVDNNAEITYYGGAETWCPQAFTDGFITNIIAHVDVPINGGFAQVVLTALDRQESSIYLADDESDIRSITVAPDYKVALKFRALPGQKKELTLQCPTDPNNTTDGDKHSYRMKLDINRLAGDGSDPDNYETVESITLVLSDNPQDVFNPQPDPDPDPQPDPDPDPQPDPDPDPGVSVTSILTDANPVVAVGNTLYYQLEASAEVNIYSVSGSHVYGGVVEAEGETTLDFLPAGLYLYKVGNHTGKIVVK